MVRSMRALQTRDIIAEIKMPVKHFYLTGKCFLRIGLTECGGGKESCRYRKRTCKNKATPSVSLRSTASRAVETALSSPLSPQVRRCVPRGLTARLTSPLPTHLLRICAGALYRHEQWGIPKFASGQSPTGALPRKHLLTPQGGA